MHIVEANDWKEAAISLLELRSPYRPTPSCGFGHTSLVAARILLQSRGVCAGRDKNIDPTGQ